MAYHLNVVQTICGSIVLLKFVESFMPSGRNSEEKVVDKLKDDYCVGIRTVSGKEYQLSMMCIAKIINSSESKNTIAQDIYDRWNFIHQEN